MFIFSSSHCKSVANTCCTVLLEACLAHINFINIKYTPIDAYKVEVARQTAPPQVLALLHSLNYFWYDMWNRNVFCRLCCDWECNYRRVYIVYMHKYGIYAILYIQSLFGSVGNHSSTVCSSLSCCCAATAISDNFVGREWHEGSLMGQSVFSVG